MILAAGRSEFAARGYAGARIDRIATRAGVNKQLIFYYFGSKAGLYQATLTRALGDLPDDVLRRHPEGAAGGDRIRRAALRLFDALAERPDLVRFIVHEAGQGDLGNDLGRDVLVRLIGDLRAVISEGQGLGYFRDDADPDAFARHAVVLAVGYLSLESVLTEAPSTGTGRSKWRQEVADLLARALAW